MRYMAPAKVNFNLIVGARDDKGMHPITSVVQTVEWCDTLEVEEAPVDEFVTTGIEVPEGGDNLVVRALEWARTSFEVPPVSVSLDKRIPAESGLGGGSADAAAMLVAVGDLLGVERSVLAGVAADVGSDVAFPLTGGTAEITGYGERVRTLTTLSRFAVAVVVPEFGLSTPQVYKRWDQLGGPAGFEVPDRFLPPELRYSFPIRNDLFRAAVDVEPRLGDFVTDTGRLWDGAVLMSGSGSACFGFFGSIEEADEAAASVEGAIHAVGVHLRGVGVTRQDAE